MITTTGFIDIIGDDRIDEISNAPDNLSVSAYRAEVILDWIPDTGQYLAKAGCRVQNGVFRTAALAESRIPAVIRHRFYSADVIRRMEGTRYVGLVVYDSEDDDYIFTLSEGAETIGIIRPWRHDNRRHLLIVEQPAHDLKPYVPFVVKAEGRGPCYLESLVFLQDKPEASSFSPGIQRLTTQVVPQSNGNVDVTLHFTTREASCATVTAATERVADGRSIASDTEDSHESLHRLRLRQLQPGARYVLSLQAAERGGSVEDVSIAVDTRAAQHPSDTSFHIPIEICSPGEHLPVGLPLTFGVPIAQGRIYHHGAWSLESNGHQIPLQSRIHSQWHDGSARWVLLDALCPDAVVESSVVSGHVHYSPNGSAHSSEGLTWQVGEEVIVATGARIRVAAFVRSNSPIFQVDMLQSDGTAHPLVTGAADLFNGMLKGDLGLHTGDVDELTLEECGTERAVIRLSCPIIDDHGTAHFRWTLRIVVYREQPFVCISQRIIVTSPVLGPAFAPTRSNQLSPEYDYARPILFAQDGYEAATLCLEQLSLRLRWAVSCESTQITQPHDREYRVKSDGEVADIGERWQGTLYLPHALEESATNIAVCVKEFWQHYPKGLSANVDGLTLELFPKLDGAQMPDYADEWWRLYFWLDAENACYRLKTGMAFTCDFLIGLPENAEEAHRWQHWLNTPAFVRPDIHYLNATHALLPVASKSESSAPQYEMMMNNAVEHWLATREKRHHYGFMNFGDTYNEGEGWANNEYDVPFAHMMEFLRGGKPLWALLAAQAARHMADIDTCHFSTDPRDIGKQYMHTQGHTGSYLPPLFKTKMAEIYSLPSHSWVEGLVLHYLLTGDETLREAALATAKRFTEGLRFYDFNNMRECGWHLIHLCGIARLTADPDFLNSASIIVERVLEKQEPGGGWEHPLSESHCLCPPPRHRGEAGFMVGVLLTGLRRFYELNPDPRVADAIVGGARWLVRHTYVPEAGLFRYTSCPNHHGPKPFFTVMVVEALADASLFTDDAEVMDALQHSLAVIGKESVSGENAVRYGKDLLVETRYIPTMLAILKRQTETH